TTSFIYKPHYMADAAEISRASTHATLECGGSSSIEDNRNLLEELGYRGGDLISPQDHRLCVALFLIMGTSALYYWNSALNTLYAVIVSRFPDQAIFGDVFTG